MAPHTKLTLGAIYPRSKLTLPPRISAKLRLALSISELLIHVCYHDPIYAEGQLSPCLYHDRRIDKVVYLHHILLLGPNSYDSWFAEWLRSPCLRSYYGFKIKGEIGIVFLSVYLKGRFVTIVRGRRVLLFFLTLSTISWYGGLPCDDTAYYRAAMLEWIQWYIGRASCKCDVANRLNTSRNMLCSYELHNPRRKERGRRQAIEILGRWVNWIDRHSGN